MSLQRSIVKNTGFLIVSRIISQIFAFFTVILIARQLGEVGLGLYSFAFAFTEILGLMSDVGIYTLVIRDVSRKKEDAEKYMNHYLSLKILLSALFLIIGGIVLLFLPFPIEKKWIIFLAIIAYSFYKLSNPFFTILRAYEKMGFESLSEILDKALTLAVVVLALFFHYGLLMILIGMILVRILLFFVSYFFTHRTIAKPRFVIDYKFWFYLMNESKYFWFINILGIVYFQVDTLMIGFIHGDAAVGIYNASYRLVAALAFIPVSLMAALFPITSRLFKEDKDLLRQIFLKTIRYLVLLAVPILLLTVILAPEIIQFLYNGQFHQSILVLQILIFAQMFVFFNHIASITLNSIDLQKRVTVITALTLLLNVCLNAFLIPYYSYNGAAIATVASELVNLGCLIYSIHLLIIQRFSFEIPLFKSIFKISVAGIFAGVSVYFFKQYYSFHLFFLLFFGLLIYVILLFLIQEMSVAEIKETFLQMKKE